jgi:hypothetical protein
MMRNTIIMPFKGNVVIDVNLGIFPDGEFIGAFRQGVQGGLIQFFE